MAKEFPKLFCIEKESLYMIGDPDTEGSATAFVAAAVTTEDADSSDRFLSEILLIVSSEESVSIQGPGVFAVRTRRALEQSKPLIPLLLRSKNPHRHESPHWLPQRVPVAVYYADGTNQGGVKARYGKYSKRRVARCGMIGRGNLYRITAVTIVPSWDSNSLQYWPIM